MSSDRLASARKAENICSHFLKMEKYQILSRNRRIGGVEIDIIAKKNTVFGPEIVLIECKFIKGKYRFFSRKQKKRYQYAAQELQAQVRSSVSVCCMLLVVNFQGKIEEQFYF